MADQVSDRFWETCVLQVLRKFKKDYKATKQDLRIIGALFERASGSWAELAGGEPNHWDLLRRCCSTYLRKKFTEKEEVADGDG